MCVYVYVCAEVCVFVQVRVLSCVYIYILFIIDVQYITVQYNTIQCRIKIYIYIHKPSAQ